MAEPETGITADAIDPAKAIERVSHPESGGLGVFIGTVRSNPAAPQRRDREVVRLEYEAHPTLAADRLRAVCADAKDKWGLTDVIALHRTGACDVGDVTVVIACSAPHRAEALDACRYIIDTIKETVPIWKREVYRDGSAWIGSE